MTDENTCSICLDSIEAKDLCLLNCAHTLHITCWTEWAHKSWSPANDDDDDTQQVTCPLCRNKSPIIAGACFTRSPNARQNFAAFKRDYPHYFAAFVVYDDNSQVVYLTPQHKNDPIDVVRMCNKYELCFQIKPMWLKGIVLAPRRD